MSLNEVVKEALKDGLMKIWREESEEHTRKIGEYYPSGIGYCLRKQYYEYEIPKPPASETLAVFATGKGVHDAVASALSKSGKVSIEHVEFPIQLKINESIKLTGRIDVLIAEVMGKRAILEIKSTSRIPDQLHFSHTLQLQAYLHAIDVDTGLLLYWDKRSGEIECFTLQKDVSWLQKIGERVIMLDYYLRSRIEPYKEAFIEGKYWECDKCLYYSECSPFTIEHISPEEKIALLGISVEVKDNSINIVSPSIEELRELCSKRKEYGDKVVILFDADSSYIGKISEVLETFKIGYDAIIAKPDSYRSATFWKLEFARRLARTYRIVYYADSSDFPEEEAVKFSAKTERIGNSGRNSNRFSATQK
jgi:CRISPR/Cas system-associated exonuclease Cas4 (RecB family)